MSDDPIIERMDQEPEEVHFRSQSWKLSQGNLSLKTKLMLGAALVGGITLGTILFLFFVSAFIYLFVPLVVILALWRLFFRRR